VLLLVLVLVLLLLLLLLLSWHVLHPIARRLAASP
jgi:hypothetical protein